MRSFIFLCLSWVQAFASPNGLEEAQRVCHAMDYPSKISECTQFVSAADYFEAAAAKACGRLGFASQQLECLQATKNRAYSETNVTNCEKTSFPSKIIECLAKSGKPWEPARHESRLSPQEDSEPRSARKKIQRAIEMLEKGKYDKAKRLLKEALEKLD